MSVEITKDAPGTLEELRRRTRHCSTKIANSICDVGASVRRAVEESADDALVPFQERGVDVGGLLSQGEQDVLWGRSVSHGVPAERGETRSPGRYVEYNFEM